MAEQFEMLQYIDIATQNLICVILRENQHQCTIKELRNVSLVLPCEASAHKPSRSMPGYPGLRHFKNGILFVSQWTGHEHKEMQQIFAGLLIGAVQPATLRTAVSVINFIYYAQLHVHTSKTLKHLQKALEAFHKNKKIFVTEGICNHFNIPKIHLMVHYVAAIQSCGSLDGYNTESPERLHIDYAKEGY